MDSWRKGCRTKRGERAYPEKAEVTALSLVGQVAMELAVNQSRWESHASSAAEQSGVEA